MNAEVSENGFDFYFDYEEYPPIGGPGGERFEVFVTRYYDRTKPRSTDELGQGSGC